MKHPAGVTSGTMPRDCDRDRDDMRTENRKRGEGPISSCSYTYSYTPIFLVAATGHLKNEGVCMISTVPGDAVILPAIPQAGSLCHLGFRRSLRTPRGTPRRPVLPVRQNRGPPAVPRNLQ